jgi:amidophosphoribosyltransferase
VYAARDRFGRTPLIIGESKDAYAVCSETTAFPNLGIRTIRELGPGEIVLINKKGVVQKKPAGEKMQVCSFLWVYYGFPSSTYEGINVEEARYRCGAALAREDAGDLNSGKLKIDLVAGIPDSGTGHAFGYSNQSRIPHGRPIVKYTPTWPRSFMPQDQNARDLIAEMKLIPIRELIEGKSLLFTEDSIVRGTQLRNLIRTLFNEYGAREVHMRPACPPLIYGCEFLDFSRSKSPRDLAGQRAIHKLEGLRSDEEVPGELLLKYSDSNSPEYARMVDWIRGDLGLTSLRYQKMGDIVKAIGLPKGRLCTHCWDGSSFG